MYYFLFFFRHVYTHVIIGVKILVRKWVDWHYFRPPRFPFNFTRNFLCILTRVSIWIIFVNRKENRRLAHDLISLFFFLLLSSMLGGSGGGVVVVDVLVKMEKCQIYWERKKIVKKARNIFQTNILLV